MVISADALGDRDFAYGLFCRLTLEYNFQAYLDGLAFHWHPSAERTRSLNAPFLGDNGSIGSETALDS